MNSDIYKATINGLKSELKACMKTISEQHNLIRLKDEKIKRLEQAIKTPAHQSDERGNR